MDHAYPPDLAAFVAERLGPGRALPRLAQILSSAYQASLLREEERPLTFRVQLATTPGEVGSALSAPHALRFVEPRDYDQEELRRLAPAAKLQRAMIGVEDTELGLRIWGLVNTGPAWLHEIEAGRRHSSPDLDGLVITVMGPGRLLVSDRGVTVAKLSGGRLSGPSPDVFDSHWLPGVCGEDRRELLASTRAVGEALAAQDPGRELLRRMDQQLLRRIIANVRLAQHGGTVVLLPQEQAERVAEARSPIALKYRFVAEEPRWRYRTLQRRLLDVLSAPGAKSVATLDAVSTGDSARGAARAVDDAMLELAHGIAGLTNVDGAVLLSKRFDILGFGGEIVGDLPAVPVVMRALDLEGDGVRAESTDNVGTRHRSLYRLVAALPDALGIVVSQDGGVRLVANKAGAVTYWDQFGVGPMEI